MSGFGSLVAAMANLIAYRLYLRGTDNKAAGRFALEFVVAGYGIFFLGHAGFYGLGPGADWDLWTPG